MGDVESIRRVDPNVRPGAKLRTTLSSVLRFMQRTEARPRTPSLVSDTLRTVLDATPSGLLLLDSDERIVIANVAAERLLRRAKDALHGHRLEAFLPARKHEGEQRVLHADGSLAPIGIETRPLRIDGRDCKLVVITDVTESRRHEREAARQRDEVAHLSRVAMLGELAGALAHEINQPLSAILSNAQAAQRLLLAKGEPDGMLAEILADIVEDDRRAGEVVRRLRKWLRKERAEHVPLGVNMIVLDALHLVRTDLLHRGFDVQLELAGNLPMVDGDRILLQQVFLNLVFNACDAMDGAAAPRMVRVRSGKTADGGARVEVLDHGHGIPPSMLPVMFEPFETSKPDGMGVGLSVSRAIIDLHNGRIDARNLPEGGACVGFELPARMS